MIRKWWKKLFSPSYNYFMFDSYEEQLAFNKWAFGEEHIAYNIRSMLSWNSLHGDKLWLKEDMEIQDSITKMKEIWIEETK